MVDVKRSGFYSKIKRMVKYRSSKDFWENKYQKRDKEHWEARRKELLESHVEESPFITYLVNLKPTPRIVLDYGCGTGKNLRALEEKLADPGTRLYGLDVSPTALELAKEYIHGRAALQMTNGTEIPFEDKFFDMSFTHCVLQHVPPLDFEKICDELIRVTRDTIIHK